MEYVNKTLPILRHTCRKVGFLNTQVLKELLNTFFDWKLCFCDHNTHFRSWFPQIQLYKTEIFLTMLLLFPHRRPHSVPRCILLISVGRAEHSFLVEPIRHYLQAYGQHILGEPAGNGNGRDAGDGSGCREREIPYLVQGLGLGSKRFLGFINSRRRGRLIR